MPERPICHEQGRHSLISGFRVFVFVFPASGFGLRPGEDVEDLQEIRNGKRV